MKITVVGLGCESGDVTVKGWSCIQKADFVILKTALAECSNIILESGISFTALDSVYETAQDFDALNSALAEAVVSLSKNFSRAVYCVPGGADADLSVSALKKRAETEVIPSVSQTTRLITQYCPGSSSAGYSAYDLPENAALFRADRNIPLVVYDIDSAYLAGSVKLLLTRICGDEARTVYFHAGTGREIALYELDRQAEYDYSSAVLIYPESLFTRKAFDYYDLVEIMQRLRGDGGCPWDRAQTHESIKSNLVEEAYELVEAIELADSEKMCEETGDVLLQTVFHAEIAEEAGEFTFTDVLNELCNKLIFRHSHIFGKDRADNAEGALDNWEKNKRIEKKQETVYDAMISVPKQFPSLLRAYKVIKKARKAGRKNCFDRESADPAVRLLSLIEEFADAGIEPELAVKDKVDEFVESFRE